MPLKKYCPGADGEFHYLDGRFWTDPAHRPRHRLLRRALDPRLAERLTSKLRVLGMDDRGHGKTWVLRLTLEN